jgi:hypothetical protein
MRPSCQRHTTKRQTSLTVCGSSTASNDLYCALHHYRATTTDMGEAQPAGYVLNGAATKWPLIPEMGVKKTPCGAYFTPEMGERVKGLEPSTSCLGNACVGTTTYHHVPLFVPNQASTYGLGDASCHVVTSPHRAFSARA